MSVEQLSLMPKFGDVEDENYHIYSAAFDAWQRQVGQYATLVRYSRSFKVIDQSRAQYTALYEAVSSDSGYQALLKIDLVTESLNRSFRSMVHSARMAFAGNEHLAKYRKSKPIEVATESDEQAALLERLELRESLLETEKEYSSEDAAKRSVYWQRAEKFSDIEPVITQQKRWVGHDDLTSDLDIPDGRQRRYNTVKKYFEVGVFAYSYLLHFREKSGHAA